MSTSKHQIAVTGVDRTGAAFQSIQARAAAAGQRISRIMGGALAAAGAYLSLRTIKGGVDELGKLSDISAATSTSVSELKNGLTGLQVLGLNTSMDQLATALAMMRKNTGREGMAGLYETVAEIGKMSDAAERSKAAISTFGRSGLAFMPLIDAAEQGVAAVRGVVDVMPKIPESAAQAGDEASDAMKMAGDGFKSIWLQAVGKVTNWIGSFFPGGIRGAMATAINYVEYGLKMAFISVQRAMYQIYDYTIGYVVKIGKSIGAALGTWFGGGSFSEGFENAGKEWKAEEARQKQALAELDRLNAERAARWEQEFNSRQAKIEELGKTLGTAKKVVPQVSEESGEEFGKAAAKASARISNNLILAGSNSAQKLSILGPSYQTEQKKQTALLKTIAENTKQTAEQTGETLYQTDLT